MELASSAMPSPAAPAETHLVLRDYVNVLRRQKWIIFIAPLITGAIALGYSRLQPTIYRATAQVIIAEGAADPSGVDAAPSAANELTIMNSQNMQDAIVKDVGRLPPIDTGNEKDSKLITVSNENESPEAAVEAVNTFAAAFVRERQADIGRDIDAAIVDVQAELSSLDKEVADARNRIDQLNILIANSRSSEEIGLLTAERDRLQTSVDSGQIAGRQATLRSSLDQLQLRASFNKSRSYYRVSRSLTPRSPISPKPAQDTAVGLAIGLVLGLCIAFLRDYLDDTLNSKEDLDAATGRVPVLSLIPAITGWRNRDEVVLESLSHPHSATSEAYRSLRTSLQFAALEHKISLIQVTSSVAGEGKTTTAANLAVTLAEAGKRVLLVDCDLRRPRAHKFFALDNDIGFTSVLLGECEVKEALKRLPGVPNLMVLPSGPPPPNPAEVLSSSSTRTTLNLLTKVVDHVIIDCPPLLPVADASILAGYVDATVLVVTAGSTTRRSLGRSLELLGQVNAPIEGIVFNRVGSRATYGDGYSYSYEAD